jgi:hypothetical protein
MSKVIGLACTSILLLSFVSPQSSRFSAYKAVEAYEIRPGILMMPRYSDNGQVCEIGLERRHYSPEIIRLDSILSREEIDQIFEELVPANERGPRSKDLAGNLITLGGHSITTNIDFENVSIQVFSEELPASNQREIVERDIVATAHWKNRKCQ